LVASGDAVYAYTGDVIAPTYTFTDADGNKVSLSSDDYDVYYVKVLDADGKVVESTSGINYTTQDGSAYSEQQFSTSDTTELKDEGTYKVIVKFKDGVTNYTNKIGNLYVKVSAKKVFLDVPNGEWYTSYVYKANQQGYVYGYNNGNFFGPDDDIKRGDVVVILARMAGIYSSFADDQTNQVSGYTNPFEDVDNGTYYAKSIAWAAHVGIVTGTSDTTFEPERSVTREEFVTMLQRYANLCENGAAVATDTSAELAKYTDGTSVCDWAKDAVAWASEKNIMTGYAGTTVLGAENTVTRAQVAKMAVTYQSEALSDVYADLY
jgi:molybdopterin converting factor small subunit